MGEYDNKIDKISVEMNNWYWRVTKEIRLGILFI